MTLFFDTETTGLPNNYSAPASDVDNWPRLVSIAWQLFDQDGTSVDVRGYLIRPSGFSIPEEATAIHGISTERAHEEGKDCSEVLKEFITIISQCDRIVAHNFQFDARVIDAELIRHGRDERVDSTKQFCTQKGTTDFCKFPGKDGYRYPSLSELHTRTFGTEFAGAHDASNDVEALQKCYWELLRRGVILDFEAKQKPILVDRLPPEIEGVKIDPDNAEFKQALDIILNTNESLYLTGKAGSGKTFFLKCLQKISKKKTVIVAPTGIAAVNAGGVTYHSQFMIGEPYVFPPDDPRLKSNKFRGTHHTTFKYNDETLQLIKSMELLVIDEISMVRADFLDLLDSILKIRRHNHGQPFGGVQLLMIGDSYQLPPIADAATRNLLHPHFPNYFFFSSKVWEQAQPLCIELQKIYRQSDPNFIALLNNIRVGKVSPDLINALNENYVENIVDEDLPGYIEVCTRNAPADEKNNRMLEKIDAPLVMFAGEITGDFSKENLPVPLSVKLKVGAQVLFIKNDRLSNIYNGLIGTVTSVKEAGLDSTVQIQLKDGSERIASYAEWVKYNYTVNQDTREIEKEIIGRYKQMPLKLAWAITVHKSQGMTFSHMIADVSDAWDAGQVYVALSRCVSLEGLVLRNKIPFHAIKVDDAVVEFSSNIDLATTNKILADRMAANDLYHRAWLAGLAFDTESAIDLVKQAILIIDYSKTERYKRAVSIIHRRILARGSLYDKLLNEVVALRSNTQKQLDLEKTITTLTSQLERFQVDIQTLNNDIESLKSGKSDLETQRDNLLSSLQEKEAQLKKEQARGFWARLFGR